MSIYTSTKDNQKNYTFSKAIIDGISEDGGLFVLKDITQYKINLAQLQLKSYTDTCMYVLRAFKDDFTDDELRKCVNEAYDKSFKTREVAEINKVSNYYLLELYHGPTAAFKDIALQFLPKSLQVAKIKNNISYDIMVLTATSGDTGKAALEGFKNIDGIKIVCFYPYNLVSKIQEKQMISTNGNNTYVTSVDGNFDDCQKIVKDIFNDYDFNQELLKQNIILSSANSINISRLVPQIVYYFYSYIELVDTNVIKLNDPINFVVPTGNFGNILAGYYSYLLGLPINKLICASNQNNVLTDFINTGIYNRNRHLFKTISPSMDIIVSSNIERLLYELLNHSSSKVKALMDQLSKDGQYSLEKETLNKLQDKFYAGFSDDKETANEIKTTFINDHKLIDPHTACASKVYKDYLKDTNDKTTTIILSTASPYKFAKDVYLAITDEFIEDEFECIDQLYKLSNQEIPSNILNLQKEIIHHNSKIAINEAKEYILKITEE